MKAIVIDDDHNLRDMVVMTMNRSGWECMQMADGRGFDVYLDRYYPDVVLVDYHLPGEDGVKMAVRARNKGVKSLVMTGFDSGRTEAAKDGIPFIAKPFTPEELIAKLTDVLQEKH